jgi:hypothetical protein
MSKFQIGDLVRVTDASTQTHEGLNVGDTGTVTDVLTEPQVIIEMLYGEHTPLFIKVDGKPHPVDPEGNWPVLDSEVEAVADEAVA